MPGPATESAQGFVEVADRVWVARYPWLDVNVSVVAGDAGLMVLDTQASAELARMLVSDLRRVSAQPVLWAVNSHEHWDHTFGNGVLRDEGAELLCHESAAETLPQHGAEVRAAAAQEDDPRYAAVAATEVVVPEHTFSSAISLDLGDRLVELVHPGRGHTSGDLVVRVPDADVVLAGDLVEQSGAAPTPRCRRSARTATPWSGRSPSTWCSASARSSTVVVPGHGALVDRDFVEEQRNSIGIVAETIRDLATRGVPVEDALAGAEWPYPSARLALAVRRGYEHLPRSQKRLPLV